MRCNAEGFPDRGGQPLAAVTMTSNAQKSDENRSKRKKEMENEATENPQLSSTDKTDLAFSESSQSLYKPEPLEEVLTEMNKEIKNLLSKYAQILSERAAMDASYVQELDGILKEARTLENHLKQKRESLKQRFTVIANSLQS
ncbi:testis-expressed protein 12 isoform X1 [Anas platyrhynchos]|uniref:testis-expressed protein 12 isoform X1 n=2 Tax=Anas platyrhynchos TaxID=8839 RepID=UPI000350CEE5|nr:testis-expressed protein 12 isoform X1 [Anas platyrhynchos]XP_021135133.1 testis-expressed protein 12 isoform X1 [Anas platyrhynchos]XP_038023629.1 testis-expressed protein 12 isoform X1 [Anas platyrhynchos]|eukprot:XP_012965125.1 testis-expressed protein 12 isoform X1 [Anas platyrhynchos]